MNPNEKPLFLFNGAIDLSTPPMTAKGRREAGFQIGLLQGGETLSMPISRPMPDIGAGVHELRIRDAEHNWRIIYRVDADRILLIHQFAKKTEATPQSVIDLCQRRLAQYDTAKAALKEKK